MIDKVSRLIKREYPVAALIFAFDRIFDRVRGRISAWAVGWAESYLGRNPRIVGSRFITVAANAEVQRNAWIEAVVSSHLEHDPVIVIGKKFSASDNLHIAAVGRIEIGDGCLLGSNVYISDHNHGSYKGNNQSSPSQEPISRRLDAQGSLIIGNNVWIGNNVVIVGPVKIGSGAVIGANSVVTKDIPEDSIAIGVPAAVTKQFDRAQSEWVSINK